MANFNVTTQNLVIDFRATEYRAGIFIDENGVQKVLYQKTIFRKNIVAPTNTEIDLSSEVQNVTRILSIGGFLQYEDYNGVVSTLNTSPFFQTISAYPQDLIVQINNGGGTTPCEFYVTVYYTKD